MGVCVCKYNGNWLFVGMDNSGSMRDGIDLGRDCFLGV